MRHRIILAGVLVCGAVLVFVTFPVKKKIERNVSSTPSFDGSSIELQYTVVVPALDSVVDEGRNVVWCASFIGAWKALGQAFSGGSLILEGAERICASLNRAVDPRKTVPPGIMYTKAGRFESSLAETIKEDMRRLFPEVHPPEFRNIPEGSLLVYAYLCAGIQFKRPFRENPKPLLFQAATGKNKIVESFGILLKDSFRYSELRKQVAVLYRRCGPRWKLLECAVDLDRESYPLQIVLALTSWEGSLEKTVANVNGKISSACFDRKPESLSGPDVLLVPKMDWHIVHRFNELEGKRFIGGGLEGRKLGFARQDIYFRLNRSGVLIKSEARISVKEIGINYVFNRPFLIVVRKRDDERPLFALWVADGELLQRWGECTSVSE